MCTFYNFAFRLGGENRGTESNKGMGDMIKKPPSVSRSDGLWL